MSGRRPLVPPEQLPQTVDVEATIAVPAPAQPVEEPKPEAAAPEAIQEALLSSLLLPRNGGEKSYDIIN